MSKLNLKIISQNLLEEYVSNVKPSAETNFNELKDSELSIEDFSFYTSVSAVFSSKIEGEDIELDSYIKHKRFGAHFLPDYTRKIDDLYNAYSYAKEHDLSTKNMLKAHEITTKHILQPQQEGVFRKGNMFVVTDDGKIEYVAAAPKIVEAEMEKFNDDISVLLKADLSFTEVLYFAAMIHLVFVKIHPFEDGNGRTGRLLEKWFLAQKLGEKAWFIQSEKYYYNHHQNYYMNIRKLGLEYTELDYSKSLPFLLMLPESLKLS